MLCDKYGRILSGEMNRIGDSQSSHAISNSSLFSQPKQSQTLARAEADKPEHGNACTLF